MDAEHDNRTGGEPKDRLGSMSKSIDLSLHRPKNITISRVTSDELGEILTWIMPQLAELTANYMLAVLAKDRPLNPKYLNDKFSSCFTYDILEKQSFDFSKDASPACKRSLIIKRLGVEGLSDNDDGPHSIELRCSPSDSGAVDLVIDLSYLDVTGGQAWAQLELLGRVLDKIDLVDDFKANFRPSPTNTGEQVNRTILSARISIETESGQTHSDWGLMAAPKLPLGRIQWIPEAIQLPIPSWGNLCELLGAVLPEGASSLIIETGLVRIAESFASGNSPSAEEIGLLLKKLQIIQSDLDRSFKLTRLVTLLPNDLDRPSGTPSFNENYDLDDQSYETFPPPESARAKYGRSERSSPPHVVSEACVIKIPELHGLEIIFCSQALEGEEILKLRPSSIYDRTKPVLLLKLSPATPTLSPQAEQERWNLLSAVEGAFGADVSAHEVGLRLRQRELDTESEPPSTIDCHLGDHGILVSVRGVAANNPRQNRDA